MLFNSIEFAIFLPIVFLLYWFVFNRNLKLQNLFIVVVSYIFYGWWDWFLFLIAFTLACSFGAAMSIKDPRFSHQSGWVFQSVLFFDFIQKPSEWRRAVGKWRSSTTPKVTFDPISNDWEKGNKDLSQPPAKDNMRNLSRKAKSVFMKDYVNNPYVTIPVGESGYNIGLEELLRPESFWIEHRLADVGGSLS